MKNVSLLALLTLLGCATGAGYDAALKKWEGQSEQRLVSAWGAPSNVFKMDNGTKIYTYMWTGQANATAFTNPYTNTTSVNSYTPYCKTQFTLDASGTVTDSRWEGHCRQ